MNIIIESYNSRFINGENIHRDKLALINCFAKCLKKKLNYYGIDVKEIDKFNYRYEDEELNNQRILQAINNNKYDLVISLYFDEDTEFSGCYASANDSESIKISKNILSSLDGLFENKGCFRGENDILLSNCNSKIIKLTPFCINNPLDFHNAKLYGIENISEKVANAIINNL